MIGAIAADRSRPSTSPPEGSKPWRMIVLGRRSSLRDWASSSFTKPLELLLARARRACDGDLELAGDLAERLVELGQLPLVERERARSEACVQLVR